MAESALKCASSIWLGISKITICQFS